jgi:hypothetical protein
MGALVDDSRFWDIFGGQPYDSRAFLDRLTTRANGDNVVLAEKIVEFFEKSRRVPGEDRPMLLLLLKVVVDRMGQSSFAPEQATRLRQLRHLVDAAVGRWPRERDL